jgi:formylglycine-generating enzyme required for sulfatase activity
LIDLNARAHLKLKIARMSELGTGGCSGPARSADKNAPDAKNCTRGKAFFPLPSVTIPGGTALIRTNKPMTPTDLEGPLRTNTVRQFRMTVRTGTNAAFARFVDETAFITEAERFG